MYPSEYAYREDSVSRTERDSVTCRNYQGGLDHSARSDDYVHCNGTPLTLADSDIGSQQYTNSDYYVWTAGSGKSQLLFIFPTIVNLTTITLHYYRTTVRGLPRLRFFSVPDDFNVWSAPTASFSNVEVAAVPPDGEPAGHRNVSVEFNILINTLKILMVKLDSSFSFAVSEVEFSSSCKYNSLSFITVVYVATIRIIYNSYSSKYDRHGNHHSSRGI